MEPMCENSRVLNRTSPNPWPWKEEESEDSSAQAQGASARLGFRVWGFLGFEVFRFAILGLGFGVWGLGFGAYSRV